jgi:hypothetical protein
MRSAAFGRLCEYGTLGPGPARPRRMPHERSVRRSAEDPVSMALELFGRFVARVARSESLPISGKPTVRAAPRFALGRRLACRHSAHWEKLAAPEPCASS